MEPIPNVQHASLTDNFSISKDVVFRELDGEVALLNLGTGFYFGLNETGTRVWHLIGQYGALQKVFEVMSQEYDIPSEIIQKDILGIVNQLCENKLLCKM